MRLSGLDAGQRDAVVFGPFHEGAADVFRAIVDPDRLWRAAPINHLVQGPDNPLGRQREVDLNAQALAVEVVQNVQQPELAPISERVYVIEISSFILPRKLYFRIPS